MWRLVFLLPFALGVMGCRGDFAPASLLSGLRVLAVRANPPEVPPGSTALLDSLVTENAPDDGGVVDYDWRVCNEAPIIGMGSFNPACVTQLDGGVVTPPLSDTSTANVTMPNVSPTSLGLPDASDGFYLPVIMRVSLGTEQVVTAYGLRYGIGHGVPPNQNPTLASVEQVANGLTDNPDAGAGLSTTTVVGPGDMPTIHVTDKVSLRVTFAPGSDETYPVLSGVNQITMTTETLTVRWYATEGEFDNAITGVAFPVTNWTFGKYTSSVPASGKVVPLYIVARDERGGVDFTVRHFLLVP